MWLHRLSTHLSWIVPALLLVVTLVAASPEQTAEKICTEDANNAAGRSNRIDLTPESSIVDYLDPALLEDVEALSDIRESLLEGKLVVIRDAFQAHFAEYVWKELDRDDLEWEAIYGRGTMSHDQYNLIPGHVSHKHVANQTTHSTELNDALNMMLNNTESQAFVESISGRSCAVSSVGSPSQYMVGDYSSPHSDFKGLRSITLLWNLSKDWDPSWGGAFYWSSSKTLEDGYHYPTFNTLLLFLPTTSSIHSVTPVQEAAKGHKRLVVSGIFRVGGESPLSVNKPIEDIYAREKDHTRLTASEASWIAHDMNVEAVGDPARKQKLIDLKESVAIRYLYPIDEHTLVIESVYDDEDDEEHNNENDNTGAGPGETEISLTPESSILDYLDPALLEDEQALDDIRNALLKGKLVVIRDAFQAHFAEYAWKQLNRDDINWTSSPIALTTTFIPGHIGEKRKGDASTFSLELQNILRMFDHERTRNFVGNISGRECDGPSVGLSPSWYQPGDTSAPHTDFKGLRSLSFIWNLSKEWDPSWGGAFYWHPAKTLEDGYHYPTFNTLILFLPTASSIHSVTPVSTKSLGKSKRLTLGGWYSKGGGQNPFTINNPIEDMYINKEDHTRLTASEASWIAHDMNLDAIEDPIRKRKLRDLKEAITNEYLYPRDESTHVLESVFDDNDE